ncbi:hypothetical protein CONPUDRAFT_71448 [Coniophora puteana RWD-64-598 SS2]|uniref:Uncharacterized protein n=1 Tax=Coniophora puteana (strain RWD-64-598) TaxID=741705 RepID=A0A5M3MVI1_CONPW|nr:uncharacterized protein CONPUDRAFT_71448 [Coniophora puteana RWD-64-598 SS2]EIW82724.1 hypothetical protein CONPUDRAFT_71448 [Coniophora puteana RWD-64-598 SS2]
MAAGQDANLAHSGSSHDSRQSESPHGGSSRGTPPKNEKPLFSSQPLPLHREPKPQAPPKKRKRPEPTTPALSFPSAQSKIPSGRTPSTQTPPTPQTSFPYQQPVYSQDNMPDQNYLHSIPQLPLPDESTFHNPAGPEVHVGQPPLNPYDAGIWHHQGHDPSPPSNYQPEYGVPAGQAQGYPGQVNHPQYPVDYTGMGNYQVVSEHLQYPQGGQDPAYPQYQHQVQAQNPHVQYEQYDPGHYQHMNPNPSYGSGPPDQHRR